MNLRGEVHHGIRRSEGTLARRLMCDFSPGYFLLLNDFHGPDSPLSLFPSLSSPPACLDLCGFWNTQKHVVLLEKHLIPHSFGLKKQQQHITPIHGHGVSAFTSLLLFPEFSLGLVASVFCLELCRCNVREWSCKVTRTLTIIIMLQWQVVINNESLSPRSCLHRS